MIRSSFAIGLLALLIALPTSAPVAEPQNPEPGEGVICSWMLTMIMVEGARRCAPDRYPDVLAELVRSLDRHRAYVRENGPATDAEIAAAEASQSIAAASDAEICRPGGDVMAMVDTLSRTTAEEIRSRTDELLARPGSPTWGTCV